MFNIFNMRKSASSKDIIMDFAKAWQTLNTKLIEKHLSSDFIYDSQWVFESLDYKGYIKYKQYRCSDSFSFRAGRCY